MRSGDAAAPIDDLHPLIRSAADRDDLPGWAVCGPPRRAHSRRVAELMDTWSAALGLPVRDRQRWHAAAILHDALRDADPAELIAHTDLDWPPKLLHGPACAARLAEDGVDDPDLLDAIAFHTVGSPRPSDLADFLYMADFLEPGRRFRVEERSELRRRLPGERAEVLQEVAVLRIGRRLGRRERLLPESVDFWNRLT